MFVVFRLAQFDSCLRQEKVSLAALKELCYQGVPEGGGRRAQAWRILLGYLPLQRSVWPEVVREKRALYRQLVAEMILSTPDEMGEKSPVVEDHPLNINPTSHWQSFFKDNEVLLQIDKDVRRLCPDLTFFQQATPVPNLLVVGDSNTGVAAQEKLYSRVNQAQLKAQEVKRRGVGPTTLSSSKKKAVEDYTPIMESGQEAHWEVVERILFLYAKLNPGQGYVQGMNEIIGPIYYVLASDSDTDWRGEKYSTLGGFYYILSFLRSRGGRLFLLFHKFNVGHQGLLHQDPGRLLHRHPGHDGAAENQDQ